MYWHVPATPELLREVGIRNRQDNDTEAHGSARQECKCNSRNKRDPVSISTSRSCCLSSAVLWYTFVLGAWDRQKDRWMLNTYLWMKFKKTKFRRKKCKIAKAVITSSKKIVLWNGNSPSQWSCFLALKPDNSFYFDIFYFFFSHWFQGLIHAK